LETNADRAKLNTNKSRRRNSLISRLRRRLVRFIKSFQLVGHSETVALSAGVTSAFPSSTSNVKFWNPPSDGVFGATGTAGRARSRPISFRRLGAKLRLPNLARCRLRRRFYKNDFARRTTPQHVGGGDLPPTYHHSSQLGSDRSKGSSRFPAGPTTRRGAGIDLQYCTFLRLLRFRRNAHPATDRSWRKAALGGSEAGPAGTGSIGVGSGPLRPAASVAPGANGAFTEFGTGCKPQISSRLDSASWQIDRPQTCAQFADRLTIGIVEATWFTPLQALAGNAHRSAVR
jgi:hypothetical protein